MQWSGSLQEEVGEVLADDEEVLVVLCPLQSLSGHEVEVEVREDDDAMVVLLL